MTGCQKVAHEPDHKVDHLSVVLDLINPMTHEKCFFKTMQAGEKVELLNCDTYWITVVWLNCDFTGLTVKVVPSKSLSNG